MSDFTPDPTLPPTEEQTQKFEPVEAHPLPDFSHLRSLVPRGPTPDDPVSKSVLVKAVKDFCRECCGWLPNKRRSCEGDKLLDGSICCLYPYVVGKQKDKKSTLRRRIRQLCIHCVGGFKDECTSTACKLYPHRFGRMARRRDMSDV
jgi:hypothetical protein